MSQKIKVIVVDDSGISQLGEMPRDRGHFRADQPGELADAAFAAGQLLQHEQPAGVGQGLEDLGLLLGPRRGGRTAHVCGTFSQLAKRVKRNPGIVTYRMRWEPVMPAQRPGGPASSPTAG